MRCCIISEIPITLHFVRSDHLGDLGQLLRGEHDIPSREILQGAPLVPDISCQINRDRWSETKVQIDARRSRHGKDVRAQRTHPSNAELCGSDTLFLGDGFQLLDKCQVLLEVLCDRARRVKSQCSTIRVGTYLRPEPAQSPTHIALCYYQSTMKHQGVVEHKQTPQIVQALNASSQEASAERPAIRDAMVRRGKREV